ncbi:two-component response regulator [Rhodobacteraceae bacterium KLH11]|nr:two-component response regulator [Rhodobacteraceae bacterium KLH11]
MSQVEQVVHIDDDEDILSITRMSLELVGGFDVVQFSSAREALESLAGLKPDLFLLDVMMPEMDGPELLQEIRRRPEYTSTPVIFMTAKSDRQSMETLIENGALACINKPFDPLTLADQLKSLVGARENNEP